MSKGRRRHRALWLAPALSALGALCYGVRYNTFAPLGCEFRWVGMGLVSLGLLVATFAMRSRTRLDRPAPRRHPAAVWVLGTCLVAVLAYVFLTFFRFHTEEVRFHNGSVELAGTLYSPLGSGPHPAVVLIHGSGRGDRTGYRVYADHFARRGIAALIYDKRGFGASTGDWRRADYTVLAQDALGGVALLRRFGDIRHDAVGLWGISQGGWIAPLAATLTPDVAFVVIVSAPGVTPRRQVQYQWANLLRRQALTEEEIQEAIRLRQRVVDYWLDRKGWRTLRADLEEAKRRPWFSKAAGPTGFWSSVPPPAAISPPNDAVVPWMRELDFDPAPVLEKLAVPMLAVFGGRDQLIPVEESRARMESVLRRNGNAEFTVKVFPEADHGMRVRLAPDGLLPPVFARGYLDFVAGWIRRHVR